MGLQLVACVADIIWPSGGGGGEGGMDIPLQEANRVVPQDGVEFSQLE